MNLLYICSEYPPFPQGGIGTVTHMLATGLRSRGHEVHIVGLYDDETIRRYTDKGVDPRLVAVVPSKRPLSLFRSRLRLLLVIRRMVRQHKIDVIEAPDYLGLVPFGLPMIRTPLVIRIHGSSTYLSRETETPASVQLRFFEHHTLRNAHTIVSVSRYAGRRTAEIFKLARLPLVIYNGVELHPGPQKPRTPGRCVFTGTLTRKKGVFELIDAWPRVIAACPTAKLDLFGKDSVDTNGNSVAAQLIARIPEGIRSTVRLNGHCQRPELLRQLSVSSVGVFPSHSETFGLAPVEAMSVGCPTIFTRRSSGPEIVTHEQDGLLVDPLDVGGISDAIIRLLADSELAGRLGEAGRRTVEQRFSGDRFVTENEQLYSRMAHRRNELR